jgi:hypothetical protein
MLPICRAVLIGLGIGQTAVIFSGSVFSQDKSVKPGINDPFKDPKVQEYI